jgi:hypothetical protein
MGDQNNIPDWAKDSASPAPVSTPESAAKFAANPSVPYVPNDPTAINAPAPDVSKEAWYPLYQKLTSSAAVMNAPKLKDLSPADRDSALRQAAAQLYSANTPGYAFRQNFNDAIDKQGGWGISEESRKLLGADDTNRPNDSVGNYLLNVKKPVQNLLANTGDLAYRGYQGLMGGLEAGASTVDQDLVNSGAASLTDSLTGIHNSFQPGSAVMNLMEALPDGGFHVTGLGGPKPFSPEVGKTLTAEANDLFNSGATRADMDAWAKQKGLQPFDNNMDAAIAERDKPTGKNVSVTANAGAPPEGVPTAPVEPVQPDIVVNGGTKPADTIPDFLKESPSGKPLSDTSNSPFTPEPTPPGQSAATSNSLHDNTPELSDGLTYEGLDKKLSESPDEEFMGPNADTISKMTAALTDAKKLTGDQAVLYKKARSEKFAKLDDIYNNLEGEQAHGAALAALRGPLERVDFEGIRDQFKPEEVDSVFSMVGKSNQLSGIEKTKALSGLGKLFEGTVPQPSELDLLSKVMPKDFIKAALKNRTTMEKIGHTTVDALNIPRALMSTFDLSAPLRQGLPMVGRGEYWNNMIPMVKSFGSEKIYKGIMDDIRSRPSYPLMEKYGLAVKEGGTDLAGREENFQSPLAERIPIVGLGVKASERAYNSFLFKTRADVFDTLITKAKAAGRDLENDDKLMGSITKFVNSATGRGDLGKTLNESAPILNAAFFSPRLLKSRLDFLNPAFYYKLDPLARTEAFKSLAAVTGFAITLTALAKAGGADVESDPRSSDFAKIKVGNTRYDILGGFGQVITLAAREAPNALGGGRTKTLGGKVRVLGEGYKPDTRLSVAAKFARSKESPVASFITDALDGKDVTGQKFDLGTAIASRMLPLYPQDAYQVIKEHGLAGVPMAVPGVFGVGMQNFDSTKKPNQPTVAPAPAGARLPSEGTPPAVAPPSVPDWASDKPPVVMPKISASSAPDWANEPTTSTNNIAKDAVESLGLQTTDRGIRSEKQQEKYYNTTKGAAKPGTSAHETGNALDIRVPTDGTTPGDVVRALMAKGFTGIRMITKRHGTGPHWHVQWDGIEN